MQRGVIAVVAENGQGPRLIPRDLYDPAVHEIWVDPAELAAPRAEEPELPPVVPEPRRFWVNE